MDNDLLLLKYFDTAYLANILELSFSLFEDCNSLKQTTLWVVVSKSGAADETFLSVRGRYLVIKVVIV